MTQLFNLWNVHTLILAALLIPMSFAVLGCDANDGPAERVGEEIDEAGEAIREETDGND